MFHAQHKEGSYSAAAGGSGSGRLARELETGQSTGFHGLLLPQTPVAHRRAAEPVLLLLQVRVDDAGTKIEAEDAEKVQMELTTRQVTKSQISAESQNIFFRIATASVRVYQAIYHGFGRAEKRNSSWLIQCSLKIKFLNKSYVNE